MSKRKPPGEPQMGTRSIPEKPGLPMKRLLLGAAGIVGLTLLAYIPAMRAGFIWDDNKMITGNPVVQDSEGIKEIW